MQLSAPLLPALESEFAGQSRHVDADVAAGDPGAVVEDHKGETMELRIERHLLSGVRPRAVVAQGRVANLLLLYPHRSTESEALSRPIDIVIQLKQVFGT